MILKIYKNTLSVLLRILFGPGCRFTPTCSEYAYEAVHIHGIFRGTLLALKRVSRCHPGTRPQYDPVPHSTS